MQTRDSWTVKMAVVAIVGLTGGCSSGGDDGTSGFVAVVPTVEALTSVFDAADGLAGGRRASMSPRTDARVGPFPAGGTTMDLERSYTGTRAPLQLDVTGDGVTEAIEALRVDTVGTFAWWAAEACVLAFRSASGVAMVQGDCAAPGGVSCSYGEGGPTCLRCDADVCVTCEAEGATVRCLDFPEPDVAEPDVSAPDTGAADVAEPDVAEPDVTEPDVTEPDVTEPDAGRDGGTAADTGGGGRPTAECSAACLEERGGECCLDCRCAFQGTCQPVCGAGTEWDCALGCCYDYDLFACACGVGETWDGERGCCTRAGSCVE